MVEMLPLFPATKLNPSVSACAIASEEKVENTSIGALSFQRIDREENRLQMLPL
ncbi:hypothetical protein V0R37_12595 [Pollutimonas sp. H1-120]|uniref:hypothetical protein n=1 Tax=Pollutimonas sp. H1-120 TaxID=3148824 RepID=UPI003B5221F6